MKERITVTIHSPKPSWAYAKECWWFATRIGAIALLGMAFIYGVPLLMFVILRLCGVNLAWR